MTDGLTRRECGEGGAPHPALPQQNQPTVDGEVGTAMTGRSHAYEVTVTWTGNHWAGTDAGSKHLRDHELAAQGLPVILGSSDPAFRGDSQRWNPEQLLVGALSQCHMLWYVYLCTAAGIVVTGYVDNPCGTMVETAEGGHFTEAVLRPQVTVESPDMIAAATALHEVAHGKCFIVNSVNFPVRCESSVTDAPG